MDHQTIAAELASFLDGDGRLAKYPSKRRPKLLSLFYLASKFETGRKYSEKEVNGALKEWHTFGDWAMLRRDLYDRGFFGRESNGSFYWLEANQPTLASFGLEERE